MRIQEVFEHFEKIHSYSFASIDDGEPEIRIAHFLTYDDEGLYFQTMKVKPFYRQLTKTGLVAVCALIAPQEEASHDEHDLPGFPPGYFIRVRGEVRELSFEELEEKVKKDARFLPLVKDIERYPAMTTFVLHHFKGEKYDYDYAEEHRDHKLERERFAFHGSTMEKAGFSIDPEKCISCGRCARVCTFRAIRSEEHFSINGERCDECGSCYLVCPVGAIEAKTPMSEGNRLAAGKKMLDYARAKRAE